MREVIIPFSQRVIGEDGISYYARVIALERADGIWEGRLEFETRQEKLITTGLETAQPDRNALESWASGLKPVYLEEALRRARCHSPSAAKSAAKTSIPSHRF